MNSIYLMTKFFTSINWVNLESLWNFHYDIKAIYNSCKFPVITTWLPPLKIPVDCCAQNPQMSVLTLLYRINVFNNLGLPCRSSRWTSSHSGGTRLQCCSSGCRLEEPVFLASSSCLKPSLMENWMRIWLQGLLAPAASFCYSASSCFGPAAGLPFSFGLAAGCLECTVLFPLLVAA